MSPPNTVNNTAKSHSEALILRSQGVISVRRFRKGVSSELELIKEIVGQMFDGVEVSLGDEKTTLIPSGQRWPSGQHGDAPGQRLTDRQSYSPLALSQL